MPGGKQPEMETPKRVRNRCKMIVRMEIQANGLNIRNHLVFIPVRNWESQVVVVKFEQGGYQQLALAQPDGKLVSLEFEFPTDAGHQKTQQLVVRCEDKLRGNPMGKEIQ